MARIYMANGKEFVVQEERVTVLERFDRGGGRADFVAMGLPTSGFRADPWEPKGKITIWGKHVAAVND